MAKGTAKLINFDGCNWTPIQLYAQIKMLDDNLQKGGGVKSKDSAYFLTQKDKVERAYSILGADFIAEQEALQKERDKKLPKIKKRQVATYFPESTPTNKTAAKGKQSNKPSKAVDSQLEYKKEVLALMAKGTKAGPAIIKAAKNHNVTVSAGMKRYPHSFIHAYKKVVAETK